MMQSPKELYSILFDTASEKLLGFGNNEEYLGATPGITAVLHTWGQQLDYHVHLHCVVSACGVKNGQWIKEKRSDNNLLFPEKEMKKVYKATFLRMVRERKQEIACGDKQINEATRLSGYRRWKVYAKAPFEGPAQVIKYLGRYTHKTAISHYRIKSIADGEVCFEYKYYADGDKKKFLKLTEKKFLRRFELHVLPKRFVRIRHYGLLTNRGKTIRINEIRKVMGLDPFTQKIEAPVAVRLLEKFGTDITQCKECATGKYELMFTIRFGKKTYSKARDVPQN